ncbi:MAG: hypothetical protein FWG35_00725, partial [Spirochaetaceae bacterium]|nr:hypothetical protein [Spirochaetaceae bacterium]
MEKRNLHPKFFLTVFFFAVCAAGFFSSCATRNNAFLPYDEIVAQREYLAAADALEEAALGENGEELYREGKDEVLRYLDTGILYHMGGEPGKSIERFNEAEHLIDENFTRSISDAVASFLLNDYSLVYFGEAYEDIYLNVFKALDFLKMGRFDGAFVEIRRAGDKLDHLEDKYGRLADSFNESDEAGGAVKKEEIEFHNSALARYINILLFRADNRRDSARIDLEQLRKAFTEQPAIYDFPPPANLDGMLRPTDKARLNVIAFAGPGPTKKASTLRVTTRVGTIVITQEEEDADGNMKLKDLTPIPFPLAVPDLNFKVQTAAMASRPSRVERIQVFVDGKPAGNLSLIEKMDKVAIETFKMNESIIRTRTIIRAVITTAATAAAKEVAKKATSGSTMGSLFSFVGGVALDVAADMKEEADLRLARYFPGKAYVGEFLVDPGEHDVSIEFFNAAG